MGIFDRFSKKPTETASGSLEERVRALESGLRMLEADFADLFDRLQRLQGRTAKREAAVVPKLSHDEELNRQIMLSRVAPLNGHAKE